MTEELEKEAEETFRKNYTEYCCGKELLSPYWDLWQDGAEFGYNKANEWHDLRKDPNDLPPRENDIYSKEVRVCLGAGRYMQSVFSYALKEEGREHCWIGCDPIAWCEEPQFKE